MSRAGMALCVVLFCLLQANSVSAFDGKRKGFVLGFGAGPSSWSMPGKPDRVSKFGLVTNLKIGHGVSDRVLVYYTGMTLASRLGGGESDDGWLILLPSLGARHYKKAQSPSVFGEIGLGLAMASDPAASNELGVGAGIVPHVGIGYEFSPHANVEGVLFAGRLNMVDSGSFHGGFLEKLFWGFGVTVQVLAY